MSTNVTPPTRAVLSASTAPQVKQLLVTAKDMEALLQALPVLMDPRTLISVLVTVSAHSAHLNMHAAWGT
jgi:hypothetical protein